MFVNFCNSQYFFQIALFIVAISQKRWCVLKTMCNAPEFHDGLAYARPSYLEPPDTDGTSGGVGFFFA
jgi:hypothetical protein